MSYGTQFNVNTTKESIETVLASGRVNIQLKDNSLCELTPGEGSLFDLNTRKLITNKVNVYEKTAWKDGKIVFRNAPLDEVFIRLSQRYNVDIVLHDEHKIADNYNARVTFTNETIQQIFSYLEIAEPIEWKLTTPVQNNNSTLTRQRIDVWLKEK